MLPLPAAKQAPFAVVDIGSNSIRLVVYERLCRAPIALFNEKSVCALGRSLATTGRLGREEMDSALHALRRFAHIAGALRAGEVEYVATEAVRQCGERPGIPGGGANAPSATRSSILSGQRRGAHARRWA